MGSLWVVGSGIKFGCDISVEALKIIQDVNKVFYLVADPVTVAWLEKLNPSAESLHIFYGVGKNRNVSYQEMSECVLNAVRQGLKVCLVSYGHPGVFAFPTHESIRLAKAEGFFAKMLPAISAEDSLFADLGVDPGNSGCQSFEATDFLIYQRHFDPCSSLILWQIGVIGNLDYKEEFLLHGVKILAEELMRFYGCDHEVFIYEASQYIFADARIEKVKLSSLDSSVVRPISTLYVPPKSKRQPNQDMMKKLLISF